MGRTVDWTAIASPAILLGTAFAKWSRAVTILRIFRVRIHAGMHSSFEAKFATVSVDAVRNADGALSVEILKPGKWEPDEYLMISRWRDEDALKRFAGENWNSAFIPAGMEQFVQECWVHHYTAWDAL